MFALTPRLTLRPGWPEDAAALADAIGHEEVVRQLAHVPWPYTAANATAFLALPRGEGTPRFVICERGSDRIIGGIALEATAGGVGELGYWLTPAVWGRGYATEAGRAVLAIARALGHCRVFATPFVGNAASARVLGRLGFHQAGPAAGLRQPATMYELLLCEDDRGDLPIAA